MPLKKNAGSKLNPSVPQGNSQQATVANAAKKWNISPETLWGVYGTESSFGANTSNSNSGPSGGAKGPFQFEDATWARYGGGGNVQDFTQSAYAAAHYLHDLGASTDPNSSSTYQALNFYNGNGGGSSVTTYVSTTLKFGKQFAGTGSTVAGGSGTNTGGAAGSGNASGGLSAGGSLMDLVTGNMDDLATALGLIALNITKDVLLGVWDYMVTPAWHWNQRSVAFYWENVLAFRVKGNQFPYGWPATAGFWGIGYAILFTDPDAGHLRPVDPALTHVAKHVRRLQSLPARRELVKPKRVAEKTLKKPPEVISRAAVRQTNTLQTSRSRTVRVTSSSLTNNPTQEPRQNGSIRSEARVDRVATAQGAPSGPPEVNGSATPTQPNQIDHSGQRPREDRSGNPSRRPAQSRPVRSHNRRG